MKRVLILCDLFPPAFGPRMGYLCKYLVQSGWEPVVVTEKLPACNFQFLENVCEVHEVEYYTAKNPLIKKLQWLFVFWASFIFNYKDKKIFRVAEELMKERRFDVVLCSIYRTFPLSVAQMISEKYHVPLVVDLRDIIEQYSGNEFISRKIPAIPGVQQLIVSSWRKRNLEIRNKVLRKAACVTTVSSWHVEFLRKYNPRVELVYNGFDPDIFYSENIPTDHFIITYTGRLLSTAMRDPSLFFEGLRYLNFQRILTPENCRVYWFVDEESWAIIQAEARRYEVLSFMEMKGFVPASQIPKVLNESSVLLLLTNKSGQKGPKGVMTTKLFEAMAVEKPILCVRNDEAVLERSLKQANAGLAASTMEEVCTFLKENYAMWKELGYTRSAIDQSVLKNYSRKEQAKQFMAIFNSLSKEK